MTEELGIWLENWKGSGLGRIVEGVIMEEDMEIGETS